MPIGPSDKQKLINYYNQLGIGQGMTEPPTDELWNRTVRPNPDPVTTSHPVTPTGYSTARSQGVSDDRGIETNIPQVVHGFLLYPSDATKYYQMTGQHFGRYNTPSNADLAAIRLHNLQELHNYLLSVGRGH